MNKQSENSQEDQQLGQRLAQVRGAFGFSQRQLSKRSGVANATISQIEAGKLNPTVGTLRKILSGLPMSLTKFFDDDAIDEVDRVFFSRDDLTELSDGLVSYMQVGGTLANRAIQFMWERYQPGGDTGRHKITHEGEECGFVISGSLTVSVAGQIRVLKAGEAYYFKSDQPHSFRNEGTVPCELITACTPPTF